MGEGAVGAVALTLWALGVVDWSGMGGWGWGTSFFNSQSAYDYYNYFIIMNYFALNPGFNVAFQQTPQNYMPRPQIQNQLIMQTISLALTKSVLNYHNVLLAQKTPPEPPKQPENLPATEKPAAGLPLCETPKLAQMQLPLQKQNKNVPKQKSELLKQKPQKKTKDPQVLSTSQQIVPEKPEKTTFIKQEKMRKKSIEDTNRPENQKRNAPPVIDLIQSSYLPQPQPQRSQLTRIREQLLLRQVEQWNDKIKCRRDKRQLRLLSG